MCAKFGCGPTVVSKKRGWYRQTDRQRKLQLYIVDGEIIRGYTDFDVLMHPVSVVSDIDWCGPILLYALLTIVYNIIIVWVSTRYGT